LRLPHARKDPSTCSWRSSAPRVFDSGRWVRSSPLAPNRYDRLNRASLDEASNEFGFVCRVFKVGGGFAHRRWLAHQALRPRQSCRSRRGRQRVWVRSSRFRKRRWVRSAHSYESVGSLEGCKFRPIPAKVARRWRWLHVRSACNLRRFRKVDCALTARSIGTAGARERAGAKSCREGVGTGLAFSLGLYLLSLMSLLSHHLAGKNKQNQGRG
jgi:hypothetical protein